MANVAGTGGAGGSVYGRPRPTHQFKATPAMLPPGAPPRKAEIDKLVGLSFTATGKGSALLAKRFKAMNLSPDELDYVKHSSASRGAVARRKANPLNTEVATALQFGINPHVFKHPIARLKGRGEFAPSDIVGRDAAGNPVRGYASMIPWFGGGEGKAAEQIIKPTTQKIIPTAKTLGQTATEGLTGARGLRATQEKLRSLERGSRAREYAKALQQNPTMKGHQEASQLLAGELPKMKFGGFQDFTPETLDAMTRAVADHPDLQPFTQKRAIDALGKIHEGKVPTKG